MKFTKIISALAACMLAGLAYGDDFSFTGSLGSPSDVQLFNFTVGAPSNVTLRTWSYAGGTNAAGTVIPQGGFDPILALYDSSGTFINQNDDGGGLVAADSVTGAHFDTYLTASLAAGNYTVAVMQYDNFAIGNLSDGFEGHSYNGFFDVTQNLRTSNWAFDILNVQGATVVGVPDSGSSLLLMSTGLVGILLFGRRHLRKN